MKSYSIKFLYVFLCICLFMALIETQPVYAAPNIIVNSTADTSGTCATSGTGTCTLRDAITFANTQTGLDIIVFDASLSSATITLASPLPSINDALTINGSALASSVTVSGNNTVQVMSIGTGQAVTIDSLVIAYGYADGFGAGIFNSGALTITNSTVASNRSINSNRGGGLYNNGGTVDITNSTFVANRSDLGGGGGIYNPSGTVTITDSTFSGNRTSAGGGGILNMGAGIVTISHSTFNGNQSLYDGAGVYNSGTLNISNNSTFSSNTSQGANGGGVLNTGTLDIRDSTFSGNESRCYGGAGLYNTSGTVTITRSTFENNDARNNCGIAAGSSGGAIYDDSGVVTVTNSTFFQNHATMSGGGIYVNTGTLYLLSSTLSLNGVDTLPGGEVTLPGGVVIHTGGGGVYYETGRINLANTIIANSYMGDCYHYLGYVDTGHHNLIEDSLYTCNITDGVNGNIVGVDPVLGPLATNDGTTQTMALLSGSPALDAGDDAANHLLGFGDQRNYYRGNGGAHSDIGAYERIGGIPVVESSVPANNGSLAATTTLTVTFDQDMLHDASADAADNTANYLLVNPGVNTTFDTLSCAGGLVSDDTQVAFSNASFNTSSFTTTLTLPAALAAGTYRLFVCGTASIWSTNEIVLNNGEDTEINFTATASGTGDPGDPGGTSSVSLVASLPATGFAPGRVTLLPEQPLAAAFSPMDSLRLQIPELGVDAPIVGVPRSDDSWDVSWLGNDAGWLNGSAYPTWEGNTVLTGHVWNADNTPGIFVNLKDLQYGDCFSIEAYGQTYTYEVRENKMISKGNVYSAFMHKDFDWVTLLSCEQYDPTIGEYPFRRLVRAILVDVE